MGSLRRRILFLAGLLCWSAVGFFFVRFELLAFPSPLNAAFSGWSFGNDDVLGPPRRLRIAAIGTDAPVIPVALDSHGNMDVPAKAADVGWFSLGAYPGERGNAVLAGHLDTVQLTPGVFAGLQYLVPGDLLVVEDVRGGELLFRVTGSAVYPYDKAPLDAIFGPAPERRLILITCQGTWDDAEAVYSDRLVVYAEAV